MPRRLFFPTSRRPLAVFVGAAMAMLSGIAGAEEAVTLKTTVVTASGIEQELRDAPASISVITREDIEKRPVQELAELIGTVEGVTLSRNGNLVPGVQIRGLGQAYTLMLIDGKRVNSTNAMFRGNDYDTGWVPVSEIERIEVVRGPMSSLYGSDAIGGVVNVITRKVGKTWRVSAKTDLVKQEDNEAGDSHLVSVSASGPLVPDVLGLRLTASHDHRDQDGKINTAATAGGSAQTGLQLLDNRQLGALLSWTPVAGHEVKLGHDDSRRNHGGFVMEREATYLSHHGVYGFGSSDITLNIDETRNLIGMITGQVNPNKANSESLDGKLILPWESARQVLTLGGEYRREKLDDPTNLTGWPGTPSFGSSSTSKVSQHAFFIEDEISLADNLKLTLGNRYDDHENFGGHNSPRAYLVWHATPELSFKGGWAKAFRAPTLLQGSPNWGSVSCGSATAGCYIVGDPGLKPETSTSKEFGVRFERGTLGGGITLFHNELKDMISIDSRTANRSLAPTYPNFVGFLPDGRPIFSYQNIASVRTKGVELGGHMEIGRDWSLRANYTYTDAKNTSGAKELPLTYRPEHAANFTVDWHPGTRWSVNATARYSGDQYISVPSNGVNMVQKDAYTVADLSVAYRIDKNFSVRAGVLNLGDEGDNRNLSSDFNEDGRRYFVSLSADF